MEDMKKYENMTVQEKWSILATVANLYYNSEMTQNEIADRMIGITYNDLEKCKNVVCIAYGEAKAKPIAGALRGGFINTFIIDSACGEKLLEQ